jgi:phage-related protein
LGFPRAARREAGFQLRKIQSGLPPVDWKPFEDIGPGASEIRIRDAAGAFRVIYVAKFDEAVYVLHCFQKKSRTTPKSDKAIAEVRYRAVVAARRNQR